MQTESLPSPSARWQQIKDVFHAALALPIAERAALLASHESTIAAEVASLLAAHDAASGFLDDSPLPLRPPIDRFVGRQIGPYRLERLLGEGGMGAVYLARREMDGFAMPVALKLIRWAAFSEDVAKRFRLERQILARLHHPHITQLLDGGVTPEGLPYLVTEFIEGEALDVYLSQRNLGRTERLQLFLAICSAVAEAHRNLVVHGDLKPSNVLVSADGHVKLLDFGISRLIVAEDAETTGQATVPAMTPAWASPEQLQGQLPLIPSDCYSLGRLLYFLLTGQSALRLTGGKTAFDVLSALRESAPPLPSQIIADRTLAGDLDNIVQKALEWSPEDRYRSVELLADDVRAHLASRPIAARAHTWRYRTGKFVRRNRAVVVAATLIGLTLLGGLASTFWQARIAQRNYERAERRFADVRRLANTFLFELDDSIAKLPGSTPVRGALVRNAVQYLDNLAAEASGDISLQEELAAAYEKVGDIQGRPATANLGDTSGALASYQKAMRIREAVSQAGPDELRTKRQDALAANYVLVSSTLKAEGNYAVGLELDKKALAIRHQLWSQEPDNPARRRAVAASLTALGGSLSQLGAWPGVIDVRQQALTHYEALLAANPASEIDQRGLALARVRMGSILIHERQFPLALRHYRQALQIARQLSARNPANRSDQLNLAFVHTGLGRCLLEAGDPPRSLPELEAGQRIYTQQKAADPKEVRGRTLWAANLVQLARTRIALRQAPAALAAAVAALAEREALSAESPANSGAFGEVAEAHEILGDAQDVLGKHPLASAEWRRAREIYLHLKNENKFNAADREAIERIETKLRKLAAPRP